MLRRQKGAGHCVKTISWILVSHAIAFEPAADSPSESYSETPRGDQVESEIEKKILDRVNNPGWVTIRGILIDPSSQSDSEEYLMIQQVMRSLAEKGLVTLWRLVLEADGSELMAVARPNLELDKDLESRGAWAKAFRNDTSQ